VVTLLLLPMALGIGCDGADGGGAASAAVPMQRPAAMSKLRREVLASLWFMVRSL
jgi:hypothetical protein